MLHRILARQLEKVGLSADQPPDAARWSELLLRVSASYAAADQDRYTMERSITISSQEMAELQAKIAEQRDKLQAIITSIADGLCVIDRSLRIVYINPAGAALLGGTEKELVGSPVQTLIPLAPRARKDELDLAGAITEAHATCTSIRSDDTTFRRLDGTTFSVALAVTGLHGSQGAVLLFRDCSEKRQLEISLRHAQKLESIGRLAAGIAHEINTPIQFIGDNIRFLGDSFDDLTVLITRLRDLIGEHTGPEAQAGAETALEEADVGYVLAEAPRAIENSLEGVRRVASIVQAMKSLAHQDRGQRTLADLNTAITNALTIARNEYKYVADVETKLSPIPAVRCYLNDVNQVILNLLVNAAHAVADKVQGTAERGRIIVETRLEDDAVVIAIRDTGTGIPEDVRARIFEPFFTTKEVGRGTGQGLALARAIIVDKHKGALWFESEVGEGTTFYVRLPASTGATQDMSPAASYA